MTHLSSLLRASTIALVAMVMVPHGARAQAYPSQDVNFICGFAAGSGADIIVRYFADKMRPLMNRTIVVQNKPGALGASPSRSRANRRRSVWPSASTPR